MIRVADTMKAVLYRWILLAGFIAVAAVYWPGLSGAFLFDDYPNIVDNHGVQPKEASIPALANAALSSPSSELKRPLSSLSFAINYLLTGLDPFWMKATNLAVHLLNGWLVFVLTCALIVAAHEARQRRSLPASGAPTAADPNSTLIAAWLALAWMLLPINLSVVLYVVQRMESLANVFVLLGLLGYTSARRRMCRAQRDGTGKDMTYLGLCAASIIIPTAAGLLAKETAILLPLYAGLVEWTIFQFEREAQPGATATKDWRILGLFMLILVIPGIVGSAHLLPTLLKPEIWEVRDFTLKTRLLSEARIVLDYIAWTIVPTPDALSFYHDDFVISNGVFSPWSTAASLAGLAGLLAFALWIRRRQPLVSLGLFLFFGCHLLTGTIIPLELVYEHRNYFASFGLLIAITPFLLAPKSDQLPAGRKNPKIWLFGTLMALWFSLTAMTAYSWGNPVRLAEELAARAPDSPRAQYELGRTYIIMSGYDPASPFVAKAYEPLEKAASLPKSSILPQQALIFLNARLHILSRDEWWDSMVAKLGARPPGVQDESSLAALTQCARQGICDLPKQRMLDAFLAAVSHPRPSGRLLSMYSDYAWNVLGDRELGLRLAQQACTATPNEPAYWITLAKMYIAEGQRTEAEGAVDRLKKMNVANSLSDRISELTQALNAN